MSDELSEELAPGDPLHGAAEALRSPVPIVAGFPERVGRRRVRRRREQRLISAAGLVGALAVVFLAIGPGTTDANERKITFEIDAPNSHSVALVGDFTDWQSDRIQMKEGEGGKWQVTVPLPPGRYLFSYLVDKEEWRADAEAASIPDDFGRPTSVFTVPVNQ